MLPQVLKTAARGVTACLLLALLACGDTSNPNDPNDPNDPGTASLNFFEQELLGTWYRFHAFDGSDQYYRFNADRTACKWEEPDGSDARIGTSSYSNWSVSETENPAGTGRYRVTITGSGLSNGLTFDYPDQELFPTDFTNLVYRPSNSGKTCE
jgi:hypothetical protein